MRSSRESRCYYTYIWYSHGSACGASPALLVVVCENTGGAQDHPRKYIDLSYTLYLYSSMRQ